MEWNDCELTFPAKVGQYEVMLRMLTGIEKDMAWWSGEGWYIPWTFIEIFPIKWRTINIQDSLSEMGIKTEPAESTESILRKVADAWRSV